MWEVEDMNNKSFNPEARLAIFKEVVLTWEADNPQDYRVISVQRDYNAPLPSVEKTSSAPHIMSLPLSKADRAEFIKTANSVFETVMWRMEPRNPELTRKLWNVEEYVDDLLTKDMLPISKDYALSLIDAFLVHHVLGLAVKADQMAN
jgi:hypothetical protein